MITRILKWALWFVLGIIALILVSLGFVWLSVHWSEKDAAADIAPKSGHFVKAADVNMYVQEWGPADGPAILFVHAAGGWSEAWRMTGEVLGKYGFHSIAADMPPLGFSERPATPRYGREDQAKRLVGVLDALHITRATVVGHSFGARAAAEMALVNPGRVSRLVLVDAALSLQSGEEKPTFVSTLLGIGPVRNLITTVTLANPLFTPRLLRLFVHNPASVTDYWVEIYRRPLSVKGSADATADWLPELLTAKSSAKSADPAAYKQLAIPTLVLWGEEDSVTPLAQGKYIASLIPNATLRTLPGVGHMPPIEDTKNFNAMLLSFLQR